MLSAIYIWLWLLVMKLVYGGVSLNLLLVKVMKKKRKATLMLTITKITSELYYHRKEEELALSPPFKKQKCIYYLT